MSQSAGARAVGYLWDDVVLVPSGLDDAWAATVLDCLLMARAQADAGQAPSGDLGDAVAASLSQLGWVTVSVASSTTQLSGDGDAWSTTRTELVGQVSATVTDDVDAVIGQIPRLPGPVATGWRQATTSSSSSSQSSKHCLVAVAAPSTDGCSLLLVGLTCSATGIVAGTQGSFPLWTGGETATLTTAVHALTLPAAAGPPLAAELAPLVRDVRPTVHLVRA